MDVNDATGGSAGLGGGLGECVNAAATDFLCVFVRNAHVLLVLLF